jgi:TrmH family RNA methyltransferase
MISQKEIKYYSSLLQKKFRQKENKFIAEGYKLIKEGIESGKRPEIIITTPLFLETNPELIQHLQNFRIEGVKASEFKKFTDTKNPQEIIAVFPYTSEKFTINKIKNRIIVYLDNINDPGNTGTIIRNCDWFGITDILISRDSVEIYNPKVVRSSMGSIFHLNIFENTDVVVLQELKNNGYQIICSDLKGEDLFNFRRPDKLVLIFSNEAHGPDEKILETADHVISIRKKGKAESLNVASASSVILAILTK